MQLIKVCLNESVVLDTFLPLTKHCGILLLIEVDFSLILQLCELCRSFLVHFLLKKSSLNPILLVHLFQQVQLMSLSSCGLLRGSCLKLCILLCNSSFNLLFFIFRLPSCFLSLGLLEQYVLFS